MLAFLPTDVKAGRKYLRHRAPKHDEDLVRLAEEGQRQSSILQSPEPRPLSRTRIYAVIGLVVMMVSTIALSAFGAHFTGRARMPFTRIIVFTATALLTCFTIIAMLIARRTPSEAILAGILEFSFGFGLLVELDYFM
jgi:hypothetical protein